MSLMRTLARKRRFDARHVKRFEEDAAKWRGAVFREREVSPGVIGRWIEFPEDENDRDGSPT